MLTEEIFEKELNALFEGSFNISKTAYKINDKGEVSTKKISKKVKDKSEHPYFTFGKAGQVTMRSGKKQTFQSAVQTFQAVHEVLIRTLNEGEYLWAKESLLEDTKSGLYFSFAFQSNLLDKLQIEKDREQLSLTSLYKKIESVYQSFEDNFYEKLGILDVKANKTHLEVKFSLDYKEPESIDFQKVKISYYILLSLLFYETNSNHNLETHFHTFFERLKVLNEDKEYLSQVTEKYFALPEKRVQRKEVIKKLKEFYQIVREKPYHLKGYEEMEISTQMLIFDAIRMGISYEILDEADHVLRLKANGKTEYLQQATRTGLVSYISSIIMENKYVSKLLLQENNFSVPKASMYEEVEAVMQDYYHYEGKEIVVKPKSTNKGIGISIFKPVHNKQEFELAIERAFLEDTTILVEEFISGIEYRFFVLDGKCRDVLLRKPANVKGDGKHTVEELVNAKNQDLNRGYDGRAPLEVIDIGDVEKLTLSQQGFEPSSIPVEGEVVYLRENSNISTGGDSINFFDEMDNSYIKVAEEISQTLDAKVCGVDLIIPDYKTPSTEDQPGYHFLEANANPGMYAHIFVAEGKGARLTMHVLDSLFPSLNILEEDTEIDV